MKIDEQITSAFDELTGASRMQTADVTTIAKRAGRRRWRNRALAAGLSVAAIVGVAGLVGSPLQSHEPTAVIFANDPEPSAEIDDEVEPDADDIAEPDEAPAAAQEVDEAALPELLESSVTVPVDPKRTSSPKAGLLTFDGEDEFVGVGWGDGGNGTANLIIGSQDGEIWTTQAAWDAGEYRVTQLSRQGDTYVAVLQHQDSMHVIAGNTDAPMQIALSSDLVSWQHVTIDAAPKLPDDLAEKLSVHAAPISALVSGDTLLVQIGVWVEARAVDVPVSENCGTTYGDDGIQIVRCDGSLVEVVDHETWQSLGLDRHSRFFVRRGDEPVREVASPEGWTVNAILTTAAGFVTHQPFSGTVQVSTDGEVWTDGPPLPGSDVDLWAPLSGSDTTKAVFYTDVANDELPFAVVDVSTGEVALSSFPLSVVGGAEIAASGPSDYGPAGWAFAVHEGARESWSLRSDGSWLTWLSLRPDNPFSPSYLVSPTDAWFPRYELRRGGVDVTEGLFGAIRLTRPGTDEVLIELSSAEFADATDGYRGANEAEPGTSFTSDGWVVSGDPSVGPLQITTDTGEQVTFSEVEAYDSQRDETGYTATIGPRRSLVVMRDGEQVWQASMLTIERVLTNPTNGIDEGRGFVLHSADGSEWRLAASLGPRVRGTVWDIAVGDDEVVLSESFGFPQETRRYPLNEDCCKADDE